MQVMDQIPEFDLLIWYRLAQYDLKKCVFLTIVFLMIPFLMSILLS